MCPHVRLPGSKTVIPAVVAITLVLFGAGVVGGAGPTAEIDEGRSVDRQVGAIDASAQSASHPVAVLTGAVTVRSASRSIAGPNASNTNVFSPVSQPPVAILVGSGVLALCLLTLMGLRERFSASESTQATPADDRAPWKPVTDAERVEQLLVEHGGYMKQSRIVEETDWSKAKVSRLLSRMADQGIVRKDKDGRENIIVLQQ